MSNKTIGLIPHLSEKSYGLAQTNRVYTFKLPAGVNKQSVASAVEAQFDVTVTKVNITEISGKVKKTVSLSGRRSRNQNGKRSHIKKAYVTLKEGQSLPIYSSVEESEAKEQATQEKVDKAAAKQAEKEAKRGSRRSKKEDK